jgi:hypothetical protein
MTRRSFSPDVETQVLVASRRRCAFCVFLDADASEKEGQIAHVDRDASNASPENAAFLCTKHHARYDSSSRQTKGHTPAELRTYLAMLPEYLASGAAWPDTRHPRTRGRGVSLELFDRRVPTYRAAIAFIRSMTNGGRRDLQHILRFAAETEEALFLFGDGIAEYLASLYKQGVRLHVVSEIIHEPARRTRELVDEEMRLMLWFTEQFEEARKRFAPYLYLGRSAG